MRFLECVFQEKGWLVGQGDRRDNGLELARLLAPIPLSLGGANMQRWRRVGGSDLSLPGGARLLPALLPGSARVRSGRVVAPQKLGFH